MNIVLLTNNSFKYEEIKNIINGYGFKLIQVKKEESINDLLKKNKVSYILREKTFLDKDGETVINPEDLEVLEHISQLTVTKLTKERKEIKKYEGRIQGYIDFSKKENKKDIYNWDDIFVCSKTMKSYYEMRDYSGKMSARTIVISKFLNDISFFEEKVDLKFNPLNQKNVVEFSDKIYNLIENNKYIEKYKESEVLKPLLKKVLSNGIFSRSAMNKKQRNYWYPALNAGLPLVPKKDEIHEVTFMFHDLMHHLIPDLILTGNDSENHKTTYIIHRMMGEAFTLVLADMVFINQLEKSGVKYDFTKRKIYPLFKELNIKELNKDNLKKLLWSNVNFALLGNDELFLNKVNNKKIFFEFKEKYEKFFIEDYRWTIENYKNMTKSNNVIKKWFEKNKDIIEEKNTIDYFEKLTNKEKSYEAKVELIFNELWSRIEKILDENIDLNKDKAISNAFKNYMIGQSILFFRYDYLSESEIFFNIINKKLKKEILLKNDINKLRKLFNLYIDKLKEENKINENISLTYKEVVPFFEAFYVFYEKKLEYKSIKDFLKKGL